MFDRHRSEFRQAAVAALTVAGGGLIFFGILLVRQMQMTGTLCEQDPNNQSSTSCHQCHTYDRATNSVADRNAE